MTDVVMPQMGESIVEGTLTKWLKKPGEHVERDEPLFEISTDKVDTEIPAPAAGTLAEVLVEEGKTVGINTVLARIAEGDGATAKQEAAKPAAPPQQESAPPPPPQQTAPAPTPQQTAPAPPPQQTAPPPPQQTAPPAPPQQEAPPPAQKLQPPPQEVQRPTVDDATTVEEPEPAPAAEPPEQ